MKRFQTIAVIATVATFLLIAVGGFVRAAGAGLGCPDWPHCFGRWIPPTDASQLPTDIDPAAFNFTLAWIEYINRLVGVTVGFLILAVGIGAWRVHRRRPTILWPALATVLLVAFQGWFGGQVVAYELDPRFVTVHLVVALAIAALLLHVVVESRDLGPAPLPRPPDRGSVYGVAVACLAVVSAQILLGAWVRGELDVLFAADTELGRDLALAAVGLPDSLHRAVAVAVLIVAGALFAAAQRGLGDHPALRRWAQLPAWLAVLQFTIGVGLASRALPPALQLAHMANASLLFGAVVLVCLLLAPRRAGAQRPAAA